jgi:hypothetical protein
MIYSKIYTFYNFGKYSDMHFNHRRFTMASTSISLKIDPDEKKELEQMAKDKGMSLSGLLREGARVLGKLDLDLLRKARAMATVLDTDAISIINDSAITEIDYFINEYEKLKSERYRLQTESKVD